MFAEPHEITRYIPQRDPMIMISEIVEVTETSAETRFEILPENVFVEKGIMREPGLVENIAQTAAAQMGYRYISKGLPVPLGYIAAVKDLKIRGLPPIRSVLRTVIHVTSEVLSIVIVRGQVFLDEIVICECELRVFVQP